MSNVTDDADPILILGTAAIASASAAAASASQSSNIHGWLAAAIGALGHGSFGVPIKFTKDIDVHPLVLQSFKSFVMILLCPIIPMLGYDVAFTPWGLLSGLLWVVGGTGGIIGIRNAGMAAAVGTWASTMVIVNFVWGILIFQEPVHSFWGTCAAFMLLIVGIIGMSRYSAPTSNKGGTVDGGISDAEASKLLDVATNDEGMVEMTDNKTTTTTNKDTDIATPTNYHRNDPTQLKSRKRMFSSDEFPEEDETIIMNTNSNNNRNNSNFDSNEIQDAFHDEANITVTTKIDDADNIPDANTHNHSNTIQSERKGNMSSVFSRFTKRQIGILFSVWNGLFVGSAFVPIHFAKQAGFAGVTYFISFAFGGLLSNLLLWVMYMMYHYFRQPTGVSLSQAMESMPAWHLRQIWKYGIVAGFLLSMGMFGSILATSALGQGVGNSLVQSKILISGLWGILFFKEISDRRMVRRWFASAIVCVVAILCLSYERLVAKEDEED
mmetsp:Transcript_28450/g.80083  ORF Transcript_28450/g.80083 Transcript_28450/m.80083 type:complete len:496 (-) Transcript_28450:2255-3742(-)